MELFHRLWCASDYRWQHLSPFAALPLHASLMTVLVCYTIMMVYDYVLRVESSLDIQQHRVSL